MITLEFGASDPLVHRRSLGGFDLYQHNGYYPLPDVVLRVEPGNPPVDLHEIRIMAVDRGPGPLGKQAALSTDISETLRWLWTLHAPKGQTWIPGNLVVAANEILNATILGAAVAEQLDLEVTWFYSYTALGQTPAQRQETIRLAFMPATAIPPDNNAASSNSTAEAGRIEAIRTRNPERYARFPGFAAIDFGTSASTVTVHDVRRVSNRAIDNDQARSLRHQLADLLRQETPADLTTLWNAFRSRVWNRLQRTYPEVLASRSDTGRQPDWTDLPELLENHRPMAVGEARDIFLDTVCHAMEQEHVQSELGTWYLHRLLRCYDVAFSTPPLEGLNLSPVVFDRLSSRPREIPSDVQIDELSPLAVHLGRHGSGVSVWHDVKGRMLKPQEVRGSTTGIANNRVATTDDLIAHAYRELIQAAENHLEIDDEVDKRERQELEHVVVTYPTTTPPAARLRLASMFRETLGINQVGLQYDEGIAAALYFLMRDFGGSQAEFGAEALRANSQRIDILPDATESSPTWQQYVMVIDIGAGTTDIALLKLLLVDRTPAELLGNEVAGRYYELIPSVVNSTGHPQLGGNVLTLRVFYWIKARIVDELVAESDDHQPQRQRLRNRALMALGEMAGTTLPCLADQVVASGDVTRAVPRQVQQITRTLIPTHEQDPGNQDTPGTNSFWTLWELAEQAKMALSPDPDDSNPETYGIHRDQLANVLEGMAGDETWEPAQLLPEKLELSRDDFLELLRPVLDKAVSQAEWLVKPLAAATGTRLNRIMFSGKTTTMSLLHHLVRQRLIGVAAGDLPPAVTIETEYAKEAASIGAAWAQSEVDFRAGQNDEPQIREGRTVISINVDNFSCMVPCTLTMLRAGQRQEPLLQAGRQLIEINTRGDLGARVEHSERPWPPLLPSFEVLRPIDEVEAISWGTYSFEAQGARESFQPNPAIWYADPSSSRGSQIRAQLEVDQTLTPKLYICNGPPHYHIDTSTCVPLQRTLAREHFDDEGFLRDLPEEIWVVGAVSKQHPTGRMLLFPKWLPGPEETSGEYFPEFFHETTGLDSLGVPGRLSAQLLPPPPENGVYQLHLGADQQRKITDVQVEGRDPRVCRYIATLDMNGNLRIHRGNPPYWLANCLRDVQEVPGSVLRTDMEPGPSMLKSQLDPFNGRH